MSPVISAMIRVLCFANQKGGVGKTTTTLNMAYHLSSLGKKVLVVDMDPQGNTSSRLVMRQDGSGPIEYEGTRVSELFAPMGMPPSPMHCPRGIDLIHTLNNDLELRDIEAAEMDTIFQPSRNLAKLFEQYDYVLIDCPPSLGRNLLAALICGTHVVCPVQLSGFAVDGVEGLMNTIIGVQNDYNPDLELVGLFVNKMDRNSKSSVRALEALREAVGELLLENVIMHRSPIDTAIDEGMPLNQLGYAHVAAKEVQAVMNEICERVR